MTSLGGRALPAEQRQELGDDHRGCAPDLGALGMKRRYSNLFAIALQPSPKNLLIVAQNNPPAVRRCAGTLQKPSRGRRPNSRRFWGLNTVPLDYRQAARYTCR